MATKVATCGVQKEKGHLYYLGKDGNVWASKMARGSDKGGNAKMVAETNVTRESGWFYFIDIEATGRNAEVLNACFEKGSSIHVEGYLRYWKWKKGNGDIRSKHYLMVASLHFS